MARNLVKYVNRTEKAAVTDYVIFDIFSGKLGFVAVHCDVLDIVIFGDIKLVDERCVTQKYRWQDKQNQ